MFGWALVGEEGLPRSAFTMDDSPFSGSPQIPGTPLTSSDLLMPPLGASTTVEKCICELCECGEHRCPHAGSLEVARHSPSNSPFLQNQSEYSRAFVPKAATPTQSFRPPLAESPTTFPAQTLPPMQLESTHQHDFQPWLGEMAHLAVLPENSELERFLKPLPPFTAKTTQQLDFGPKPIPPENLFPQKRTASSTGPFPQKAPFAGESSHRTDFGPKRVTPPKAFVPPEADHRIASKLPPLEAETTHSRDFRVPEGVETVKVVRRPDTANWSHFDGEYGDSAVFEDQTEHRANFGPKLVEPSPSFRPKSEEWRPSSVPMEAKSEYQQRFTPISDVARPEPVKPPQSRHVVEGPFIARSTTQVDFGPKPALPERICPAEKALTRRDPSFKFTGIRDGHRYYRRFQAKRPESTQRMRLPPVQG